MAVVHWNFAVLTSSIPGDEKWSRLKPQNHNLPQSAEENKVCLLKISSAATLSLSILPIARIVSFRNFLNVHCPDVHAIFL